MSENIKLDEEKLGVMGDAVKGLVKGTVSMAEARRVIAQKGEEVFGPHEDAISKGTARIPGFVLFDESGYDLDLARHSVGEGWGGILERLWAVKPACASVTQVKEKFGGLRVYHSGIAAGPKWTDEEDAAYRAFEEAVDQAEGESYKTCEECGAPGVPRRGGWIKTLCETHASGRPPYKSEEP